MRKILKYLKERKRLRLERELSAIEIRLSCADWESTTLANSLRDVLELASTSNYCYYFTIRLLSKKYLETYWKLISLRKRKINIEAELSFFPEHQNTEKGMSPKLRIVDQRDAL